LRRDARTTGYNKRQRASGRHLHQRSMAKTTARDLALLPDVRRVGLRPTLVGVGCCLQRVRRRPGRV